MTDPRDECEIFQRLDGGTMASSPQGPTSPLATRRTLAAARCFGEVGSLSGRQDANAEGGDRRQPVGSDGRSWRSLVVEFGR